MKTTEFRRRINKRFHIQITELTIPGVNIVKTSNSEPVPIDEPLFIIRGRDHLALQALEDYRKSCVRDGCNEYFLSEIDETIAEFRQWRVQNYDKMKQPGVTKGE